MSATVFSSSETAALSREVEVPSESEVTIRQIWNKDQSQKCIEWIYKNNYKRVCLQFPDEYLKHSNAIAKQIKEEILASVEGDKDFKVFILADTSYGSCCVDEIAAAHVDGDSVVHFGNACRSRVLRLPVYYTFPEFDIDDLQKLYDYLEIFGQHARDQDVTVYLDIGYHHLFDKFSGEFGQIFKSFDAKTVHVVCFCGDQIGKLSESFEILTLKDDFAQHVNELDIDRLCLFVGGNNQRFFNLYISTRAAKWFIYDPILGNGSEKNIIASYIRRRNYYIEKCKDAVTLGLIVGTLTVDGYLDVVKRLQMMAKSRGIKTQIISVGRINPAKLANFIEIDCYVLIGCAFNYMFQSKEFYKPVVSVFEAEIALNPAWQMRYPELYITDFKQLLPNGNSFLEFDPRDIYQDDISLLTGRVRYFTNGGNSNDEVVDCSISTEQRTLSTRSRMEIMTSNSGLSFEDRTWKGLIPDLGKTEPAKLQKGLSGIPIKYTHD